MCMCYSKESSCEERPLCCCGAHIAYGRSRMGMLSDPDRKQLYIDVLRKVLPFCDDSVQYKIIVFFIVNYARVTFVKPLSCKSCPSY